MDTNKQRRKFEDWCDRTRRYHTEYYYDCGTRSRRIYPGDEVFKAYTELTETFRQQLQDIVTKCEPLGPEFSRILADNLTDLYE